MQVDNAISDLKGVPQFRSISLRDNNPLSGRFKRRVVWDPNPAMREVHAALIADLRSKESKLTLLIATGSLPGSSPKKNVEPHRRNRFFYLTDIKAAYPSTDLDKLAKVLCEVYPSLKRRLVWTKKFLKRYCAPPQGSGLAIGAPASPDLFNIYAGYLLDLPLSKFCIREGITVTRYLDDLTFSSEERIGKETRRHIREFVDAAGFQTNHAKSEVSDLKLNGTIRINGVGLEFGGRLFLPRHYLNSIGGHIHAAMSGRDVSVELVAGMMSLFYSITDRKNMNATERRVDEQFKALLRMQEAGRR